MTAALALRPGVEVPLVDPGSPAWLQTMSASKIAAVVGLSPYQSPFSLWWRMAGRIENDIDPDVAERGHLLEPPICEWFARQHPDWTIQPTGTWQHPDDARWTASPDRLVITNTGERRLLQVKTNASSDEEWGTPGTDEIPPGYRAQVIWEMACVGVTHCHVSVLSSYLRFADYLITFDQAEFDQLAAAASAFLDTLPGRPGERVPDIDDSDGTYWAVRALHPDINGEDVEIPVDVAERFETAYLAEKAAATELTGAKSALLDAMGDAKNALCAGLKIARRQPNKGGVSLVRVPPPKTRTT